LQSRLRIWALKPRSVPQLRPAKYRARSMKVLGTSHAEVRRRGRDVSHVGFARRSRCCSLILSASSGSSA
jgi:hypothetical protein